MADALSDRPAPRDGAHAALPAEADAPAAEAPHGGAAAAGAEAADEEMAPQPTPRRREGRKPRPPPPAQLMLPEWCVAAFAPAHSPSLHAQLLLLFWCRGLTRPWRSMLDVPADLAPSWLVAARPEGPRCLVVAARGATVARGRDGALLHRFASQLPAGSRATAEGHDSACILDCILHQARPARKARLACLGFGSLTGVIALH